MRKIHERKFRLPPEHVEREFFAVYSPLRSFSQESPMHGDTNQVKSVEQKRSDKRSRRCIMDLARAIRARCPLKVFEGSDGGLHHRLEDGLAYDGVDSSLGL